MGCQLDKCGVPDTPDNHNVRVAKDASVGATWWELPCGRLASRWPFLILDRTVVCAVQRPCCRLTHVTIPTYLTTAFITTRTRRCRASEGAMLDLVRNPPSKEQHEPTSNSNECRLHPSARFPNQSHLSYDVLLLIRSPDTGT